MQQAQRTAAVSLNDVTALLLALQHRRTQKDDPIPLT